MALLRGARGRRREGFDARLGGLAVGSERWRLVVVRRAVQRLAKLAHAGSEAARDLGKALGPEEDQGNRDDERDEPGL